MVKVSYVRETRTKVFISRGDGQREAAGERSGYKRKNRGGRREIVRGGGKGN
jgi:hypothetical protein